jgi:large subunit ribosomal protein L23
MIEKNTALRSENKYVFEVVRSATTTQTKEAVEKLFGVDVVSISTLIEKSPPNG